ncbi:ATP-dependent DNA helicase PIF1-like protein [Tanacetum coccineum]
MRLAASSMAEKRAANLKGKAIVDTPNVAHPETGCKTTGATSISKKITADLKGKAIGDPNNLATTKTGRTTIGVDVFYHSLGAPSYQCPNCNATMWYEKRNNKANKDQNPTFSLCCQQGKVLLPRFKDTPEPLNRLLDYNQPATSTFRDLIRVYNGMFCFTSFGAKIYHSINKGRGLYTLSLLPIEGTQPSEEGVNGTIVGSLIRMLDANSAIAKAFRMARDWCHADTTANVELRMLSERTRSKQYNSPNVAEVAALITNDFGDEEPTRDIVVCKKDSLPKIIPELHPSYMALQYHLLFPYGEDGYHEKIPYHTNKGKRKTTRDYVTMKEYYAYVIQYRKDQRTTLHRGRRVTQTPQAWVKESLCLSVLQAVQVVYVIEFQKRGLPHAHILLWLKEYYRCKATTNIDDIISAELPSPTTDPAGYKAVSDYMLQGPCGNDNKAAENVQQGQGMTEQKVTVVDEIKNYLNCRYLAPCKAVWRIFSFDIHHSYLSVMKLNFHLPNQQPVTLHDTECLPALLQKEAKKERPQKQRKCIGRIVYSTPSAGEHYFLRMLLNVTRAIQEASLWALGPQLRDLFMTILLFCDLTTEQIQNYCLMEIQDLLNTNGRTLTEFCDMPQPNPALLTSVDNRLIREARAFDMNKSKIQHQQLYPQLNPKQRLIYEEVVDSVHKKKGIASLLLPGGRTAHSRFVIPLELLENSTCGIKQNIHLAELMQQANSPGNTKGQEGRHCTGMYQPLRTMETLQGFNTEMKYEVPARIKDGEDKPTWIEIPETFLIPSSESPIQQIVEETYPNFIQRQKDDAYLRERAILTPRNDNADAINAYMFDKLAGQGITYHSADEICKGSTTWGIQSQYTGSSTQSKWPFVLKRQKYPIRPC